MKRLIKNIKNHRNIKLATTDKRRNKLPSEPNYHTTKHYSEKLLAIGISKINVKIAIVNKSVNFKHKKDSHVQILE